MHGRGTVGRGCALAKRSYVMKCNSKVEQRIGIVKKGHVVARQRIAEVERDIVELMRFIVKIGIG